MDFFKLQVAPPTIAKWLKHIKRDSLENQRDMPSH